MKQDCKESGHFEIGMSMVGHVLKYAPPDPDGLWIHRGTASVLNAKDAANMRDGFRTEFFNSRGVHGFSGGENEKALAERYRDLANSVEEAGFVRVATTMRELAAQYDADAKREAASRPFEN